MSPLFARVRITWPISLITEGCMPSVGSSRISSRGRLASARPIASCCCCPPERSPPRRCFISLSTGNSCQISSGTCFASRAENRDSPSRRFSSTVRRGKISRPCGTYATPDCTRWCGLLWVIVFPCQMTSPVFAGISPIRHFSSVVFPTPLRPSRQVTSPVTASKLTPRRIWLPP